MTRDDIIYAIREELKKHNGMLFHEDDSREAYLYDEYGSHRIEGVWMDNECGITDIYVSVDAPTGSEDPRESWDIDCLTDQELKTVYDFLFPTELNYKDNFATLFERAEKLKKDMQDAIDVAVMQITEGSTDNDIRLNHPIVCDDDFTIQYIGIDPYGDGIVLFNKEVAYHAVDLRDDCIDLEIILGILTMLNGDAYTVNHH